MSSQLRQQALSLYQSGLAGITPGALVRDALSLDGHTLVLNFLDRKERVALPPRGRVLLVSVGKAAVSMAVEARRIFADGIAGAIADGIVVTKHGFARENGAAGDSLPWPVMESGHPVPDEAGVEAARAVTALLQDTGPDDTVLVMVSGGASALLPAPVEGITLADKQALAGAMLREEMDIHQINAVRKAVSRLKGGGLAALAAPSRVVGLYLSDVPGDRLASIGSGPTIPEAVDFPAVVALLREKGLWEDAPESVREVLEAGRTPLREPPAVLINGLIGANRHLLRAIADAAGKRGMRTAVRTEPLTGPIQPAMAELLARWREHLRREHTGQAKGNAPVCLVSGGEITLQVTGGGMGGRCQELAARMMPLLEDGEVFLAAGSDGNDGPTDAAGGVVDRESWSRVLAGNLPYQSLLDDNDSYHLLERSGNLIKVPPTGNNVMDVYLFLAGETESGK